MILDGLLYHSKPIAALRDTAFVMTLKVALAICPTSVILPKISYCKIRIENMEEKKDTEE